MAGTCTKCGGGSSGGNITATIDVNWTFTGAPGTAANVTNIGNNTVAELDFTVPQGANGATGPAGPMGPAGTTDTSWNFSYFLRDTTRPLTGNAVYRDVTNSLLTLYGGTTAAGKGGAIALSGADRGGVSIEMVVPNAAKNGYLTVMTATGITDTPRLRFQSMNLTDVGAPVVSTDAATKQYVDGKSDINESYAYLPGRAGGQTLYGGTTTGDNLNLYSNPLNDGFVSISSNYIANCQVWIDPYCETSTLDVLNSNTTNLNYPIGIYGKAINSTTGLGIYGIGSLTGISSSVYHLTPDDLTYGADLENFGGFGDNTNYGAFISAYGGSHNYGVTVSGDYNEFYGELQNYGSEYFDDLGDGSVEVVGGYLTTVSDEKAKTNIIPFTSNITKLKSVVPISYYFNEKSGLDTTQQYTGFSAQNLLSSIPEAVSVKKDFIKSAKKVGKEVVRTSTPVLNPDGTQSETYSISDRAIIAVLVNSVKEQQEKIDKQDIEIAILKAKVDKLVKP